MRRERPGRGRMGVGCVAMTQSEGMGRYLIVLLAGLCGASGWSQSPVGSAPAPEESYKIYTERPRIFLRPQRLRLLRRERDRQSLRWTQFDLFLAGKAPMPEPGFAGALYYAVSGDAGAGKQAIVWVLAHPSDLRQLALVADWCHDLLTPAQATALAGLLRKGVETAARSNNIADIRGRTLAAAALADRFPDVAEGVMRQTVRDWWEGKIVPALKDGKRVIAREDAYALCEILHVVRDNLNIDLRDSAPAFFKNFPIDHLMSHYPAIYPAADGDYRIPAAAHLHGEPDLKVAALSRAAELSMVAFDPNSPETQVLQGWLINDHFLMRGTFGIPYEFLWANPYQPGLSYYHIPLIFHDETYGRLFIRSSWEDSAAWLGIFDGEAQLFEDGKLTVLNPQINTSPLPLTEAVVLFGSAPMKFKLRLEDEEAVFVVGLKPLRRIHVEIDNQEMYETESDAGGIVTLSLPRKAEAGVRLDYAPSAQKPAL